MKIPLSNRLLACCGFVNPGDRVADVGCDHGYLGIYLLKNGIAGSVIASDIKEGPLQSALRNAVKFNVRDKMTFYLSNGVQGIPRDFDTLVCAGMGADTMMSVLDAAPWLKDTKYRLILQCQSKRPELRKYLYRQGYAIRRETLAQDGKFLYPVMEAVYAPGESLTGAEFYITPALLASGSPLLPAFLRRVTGGMQKTVDGLSRSGGEKYREYLSILDELKQKENALCQP
ncbi:MAG: class I SAM-dependent methyltransferase [Eubacteriales bacterium]|nr:class I SAM-dependent methyltransferase [Eubacteriales bacterium]